MIKETITFTFENEEQQHRFHKKLKGHVELDIGSRKAIEAARMAGVMEERKRCLKIASQGSSTDGETEFSDGYASACRNIAEEIEGG